MHKPKSPFAVKCWTQKSFLQPTKHNKAGQKGHSFIFHVPFIFPSSGDKLLGGKASRLSHYELFLIALNLLAVKMRQIPTKIEAI